MTTSIAPRRVSTAWKLTGFFFLFGVVLSYGAFLAYGKVITSITLRVGSSVASSAFDRVFETRDAARLRLLASVPDGSIAALERALPFLQDHQAFSGIRIFGRVPGGDWLVVAKVDGGSVSSRFADPGLASALEASLKRPFYFKPGIELVSGKPLQSFIRISPGPDGTEWVLGADVDPVSLGGFLLDHGSETLAFSLMLAGLSLALGHAFARRFTKPMTRLADAAERYGKEPGAVSFYSARRDEIGVLGRTLDGMAAEVERRRVETESRLAVMEAMNSIDKAVLTTTSRSELFSRVASIVYRTMHSSSVAIALRDDDRSGWTIGALSVSRDRRRDDYAGSDGGPSPAADLFAPFVSDSFLGPGSATRFGSFFELPVREADRIVRVLACDVMDSDSGRIVSAPLRVDGICLGALVVVAARDDALTEDERRTFTMLADQTAVALRSILEREAREDNFLGVIRSLSRAIDAKSRWTAGHSERVAVTAGLLGEAIKLPADAVRELGISATLHDVGKIGVVETILDKPGKLSAEEYGSIKKHPSIGAAMLEGIRSFEPVVPAVLHHHERWDGSGYPAGLAGDAIPLAARVIAIADVWDAICDDRPYRKGFSREEAVRFMIDQAGVMFDPGLVDVFVGTVLPRMENSRG